jgi:hypothetical protein
MGKTPVAAREVVVDRRGRTSLHRIRTHDFDRYLAVEHEDGTIVLTPAITMTPAELRKLADGTRERP